jgi:hypothetical protein
VVEAPANVRRLQGATTRGLNAGTTSAALDTMEGINLCHFSSVRAVGMIGSLTENFKMRFNIFCRLAKDTRTSENLFLLKSVMLRKNCSLNRLHCGAIQLWLTVSISKFYTLFVLLYQYLCSMSLHETWQAYFAAHR